MTDKDFYLRLYKDAEDIINRTNICDHDKNGMCIRERDKKERKMKQNKYCCCGRPDGKPSDSEHCKHLKNSSCSIKSLHCKLWLCEIATKRMKEEYPLEWNTLHFIEHIAKLLNKMKGINYLAYREEFK